MQPASGRSLHIGLNRVDPAHYGGWSGDLAGCEFDANDMESIAKSKGFSSSVLLTEAARSDVVLQEIGAAAEALNPGDIFLLTYSGHGGQVPDLNGDEDWDRYDETWVLYDRQLVDDELYALWGSFATGVRVVVLSDSCHSGSVARAMFYESSPANETAGSRFKNLPIEIEKKTYREHQEQYDAIQTGNPQGDHVGVGASVLLISGCMDNQLSRDGERNGLFTQTLKEVWADGSFSGPYPSFRNEIVDRMPSDQTPNFFRVGQPAPLFEQQTPFTI